MKSFLSEAKETIQKRDIFFTKVNKKTKDLKSLIFTRIIR